MNRWIEEFKKIIRDESIIKYYEEEILTLDNKDYDYICKMIGNPKKVAKVELRNENTKNKVKTDYKELLKTENLKWTLFALLPLVLVFIFFFSQFLFVVTEIVGKFMELLSGPKMMKHAPLSNASHVWIWISIISKLVVWITLGYLTYEGFNFVIAKVTKQDFKLNKVLFTICTSLLIISVCGLILSVQVGNVKLRPRDKPIHKRFGEFKKPPIGFDQKFDH